MTLLLILQLLMAALPGQEVSVKIKSPYQEDSTLIRRVSTEMTDDSVVQLVFVLPVEASKTQYTYGVGIEECQQLISRNRVVQNVVFIQPDYTRVPWYGNHISNEEVRQLDYTRELITNTKAEYEASGKKVRVFLLGFSKSGWGSMHILLEYPRLIEGILIWDAPLSTRWNEKWGMQQVFGNEENFMENHYLLRASDRKYEALKNKTIVIGGYDYFESSSTRFLTQLEENGIPYFHDNTLKYPHKWDSRWIARLLSYCKLTVE